ncbi:hypothetical protein OG21DRAFT_1512896 [Imleria badia]|nr:hypothetical protein OG21DRAFT_1512896 [Imleria badia]
MGVNTFFGAITKAHQLVASLHKAGGVDLLLFCIRGGRITTAMQRTYHLFFDILCGGQVPLAIVVTNLEQEEIMENWWVKNEEAMQQYGIHSVAHACITAVPARVTVYAQKRAESQKALRMLLLNALSNRNSSYVKETRSWFVAIVERLRSFLTKKGFLKKKVLLRRLETECMLPRSDAEKLAEILTRRDN